MKKQKESKRIWEMDGPEFERYLKRNRITGLAAAFADTKRRRMMKNAAAKLTLLFILCTACHAGTVNVKFDVPDRYLYKTIDDSGTVELWEKRPRLFTTDSGYSFWWEDSCGRKRGVIVGGVPSKHWKHSLRRIRN